MGDEIGVELDDIAADVDYKPSEKESKRANKETKVRYEDRFESILTDWYDDKKNWWDAVEDCIKKDGDFSTRIASKSQEDGEKPRRRAIVEVMVDLLLEMEDISKDKALVYVSEEGLSEYPLEFMLKELLRRGADPNKETGCMGDSVLQMAVTAENLELVKLLLKKGAHLNKKDDYGSTPLLDAVNIGSVEIVKLLIKHGANVHAIQEDKKTCLHLASQNDDEELVTLLLEQGLSVDEEDKNGWTPLHDAAYYGCEESTKVLISKGANVNATDAKKQTPLHVAAEEGEEDAVRCLLDHHADAGAVDYEGYTPLDLAAKEEYEDTFEVLITHSSSTKHDENHRKLVKKLMEAERVKDDIVAEKLNEMSPFGVINMMKPRSCGGEGYYNFIKQFVKVKSLKESTRTVMDQFVLGHRRVNCEIIDADEQGIPPDEHGFNAATSSLLDVIVETGNQDLARHPAIKAIVDHKWKKFVRWRFLLSFGMYMVRMLLFSFALIIAARPDLDNPGCYRNGWDILRGILEGLSLILFLFKAYDEISEFLQYRMSYLRDFYNYFQISAIVLPFTIIPFRAATTWCASTGVGYCALPEGNVTDINQPCIVASHVQWIFASFAYLANAALILEYLSLFKITGVYVRILLKIVKSDIVKFTILYIVFLFFFVGAFYFALRAGVTILSDGRLVSDVNLFSLETLYPWHVLFTGLRILVESGSIIEGYFATDDTTGVYIGYQWFSILMYLLFLFTVIVVLLNLLIAQMSDSYTKVQEDVEGTFAMARARIVARLQKGTFIKTSYRKKFYQKYLWIDAPKVASEKSKEEEAAAKLHSLSERVDKLTRLTEELADELLKEKRAKDKEMEEELNISDLEDLSDISLDWSDEDNIDGDNDDDDDDLNGDNKDVDGDLGLDNKDDDNLGLDDKDDDDLGLDDKDDDDLGLDDKDDDLGLDDKDGDLGADGKDDF